MVRYYSYINNFNKTEYNYVDVPLELRLNLALKCNLTPETVIYEKTYTLTENEFKTREMLIKILSEENGNENVIIPDILPKFITVQKLQVNAKFIKDYDSKNFI